MHAILFEKYINSFITLKYHETKLDKFKSKRNHSPMCMNENNTGLKVPCIQYNNANHRLTRISTLYEGGLKFTLIKSNQVNYAIIIKYYAIVIKLKTISI